MSKSLPNDRLYQIIEGQHVTEKTTRIGEFNQYGFRVRSDANKTEIKEAIERIFEVKVLGVSTANYSGKRKMRWNRQVNKARAWKKAYVSLAPGDTIDVTELE